MTPALHALLAVLAQVLIGMTTGNWWAGAAFGSAFYFGREVAQHEQARLAYYGFRAEFGGDEGMPWYEGFKLLNWSLDAKSDLVFPVIATCLIATFYEPLKGLIHGL